MNYSWLEEYCLNKPGAAKEFKAEWGVFLYTVGGKMFLMDGENGSGEPILTLKLEPPNGEIARKVYPCVEPGYYMNKIHWNSISRKGDVPDGVLQKFIDESYRLIVAGLPKSKRP